MALLNYVHLLLDGMILVRWMGSTAGVILTIADVSVNMVVVMIDMVVNMVMTMDVLFDLIDLEHMSITCLLIDSPGKKN